MRQFTQSEALDLSCLKSECRSLFPWLEPCSIKLHSWRPEVHWIAFYVDGSDGFGYHHELHYYTYDNDLHLTYLNSENPCR